MIGRRAVWVWIIAGVVGLDAHAARGIKRAAGVLVTPSVTHRSLKAAEVVPRDELGRVVAQLGGRTLWDASSGLDRLPKEGLVFVDTTVPGVRPSERTEPQRDAVVIARGEGGVTLQQLGQPVAPVLEQVAAIGLAELPPAIGVAPDQVRLAASHPRLYALAGDTLHLVTNDLRPDDQIGPDGVLAYKLAWEVHVETVDLRPLLPDDPAGYRVFALFAVDPASGPYGAPVAWVLPWKDGAVDTARSGLAVTWLLESVPGKRVKDWFPYVRRLDPGAAGGRRR